MAEFTLDERSKKSEIIKQYKELLKAYKKKHAELEDTRKKMSELSKADEAAALEVGEGATVRSVIDSVGALRVRIGDVLNDLTEQMSSQAEKLVQLKKSIQLKESKLKELHEIEDVADALAKLLTVYDERSEAAEKEFTGRMAEMQEEFAAKNRILEQEHLERESSLNKAIAETREKWKEEQERTRKEIAEQKALHAKEREREESEWARHSPGR